ncbi:MAG: ABC transporter ATP-binding protein [Anaerolineae bacterium]|nr:ABC transporter ATP-binding protein [Anaerolineae bacterium]
MADNVVFGLKMKSLSTIEQQSQVEAALKLLGLAKFSERDVTQLSGGEKQRVALARSLAPQPRLLMLDEPLGSLDAGLRERLMIEVRDIIKQVGLTAIYVTHDQQEAYAVADRIAIMHDGNIVQVDTPQNLYQRPKTPIHCVFSRLENIFSPSVFGEQLHTDEKADAILLHPDGLSLSDDGAVARRDSRAYFSWKHLTASAVKIGEETLAFQCSHLTSLYQI